MLTFGVVAAGALLFLALLITAVVHGGPLGVAAGVLLAVFAIGAAAVGAVLWLALRLWRRHAWTEAGSLLAGQPRLGRIVRLARVLLAGRALWHLRTRLASRT
jgi:hypothetical protein